MHTLTSTFVIDKDLIDVSVESQIDKVLETNFKNILVPVEPASTDAIQTVSGIINHNNNELFFDHLFDVVPSEDVYRLDQFLSSTLNPHEYPVKYTVTLSPVETNPLKYIVSVTFEFHIENASI